MIFLSCGHRLNQLKSVIRLGEKSTKGRNKGKRPILVKFDNSMASKEVLDRSPRLSRSALFGNVFVKADLPASQRSKGDRKGNAWTEVALRNSQHNGEQRDRKDSSPNKRSSNSHIGNQATRYVRKQKSECSDYSDDSDYSEDDGYDTKGKDYIWVNKVKYYVIDSWKKKGQLHYITDTKNYRIGTGNVRETKVHTTGRGETVKHMSGNEGKYRHQRIM